MKHGRPLRFLALTLGGWTAMRVAMLWPVGMVEEVTEATRTIATAERLPAAAAQAGVSPRFKATDPEVHRGAGKAASALRLASRPRQHAAEHGRRVTKPVPRERGVIASDGSPFADAAGGADQELPWTLSSAELAARPRAPSRLRGDTWLVARPTGGDTLSFGQLGASQAGLRLTYAVDAARRVAVSARISAPLRGRGREAAFGVDWQPTALPVHLLVEERVPLDGGPARPAAQLIAGVAHRARGLSLEAYGQAGAVHRRGGFADAAARLTRPLFTSRGATVDLGAGGWGAAQRGLARLDVGPTLGLVLPARNGTVRLSADYRLRVAGHARPGSGPALTLGSSF